MNTENTHGTEAEAPKPAPGLAWFPMKGGGKTLQKVSIFNFGDEWVAARSMEEAKKCYVDDFAKNNLEPEEIEENCARAYELTDDQMDTLKHSGDDGERGQNGIPFRQELQNNIDEGVEFPCIFASRDI